MQAINFKCLLLVTFLYCSMNVDAQTVTPIQDTIQDTAITKQNEMEIGEVVVIGYGSHKKVDNTMSISSIDANELIKTKVANASQAIQGKVAGVQISASDLPGSTPTVIIRGLGTALGGRDPLYVVDGLFVDNINNINANDILSYDVLKDASALAIYGNRAANGVIIITTKSGKGKGITVEYDGFFGIRTPLRKVKMAGSNAFAYYNNTSLGSTRYSQDQPVNTDWFNEITRTGMYTQHNLSLSGVSEHAKYFLSIGNYDEKSILKGTNYNRSTIRTHNEFKFLNRVTISQNLNLTQTNTTPKPLGVFTDAYKQSPLIPVYFPSEQYGVSYIGSNGFASTIGQRFNDVGNPAATLAYNDEKLNSFILQGGLKMDIDLFKGLKFTSQFSGEYSNYKSYNYVPSLAIWLSQDPTRSVANYLSTDPLNSLTNTRKDYFNWVFTNFFTYTKTFLDIHDIEVMVGTESTMRTGENELTVERKNMIENSNYWDIYGVGTSPLNYASQVVKLNSINNNNNTTLSYFGRLQYKLMNKYLLTATLRKDGSSQFSEENKWGTFPSFGAGWIISNENFLKNNPIIKFLKLRASWGRLGNQKIPTNYLPFATGVAYNYAFANSLSNGTTIDRIFDPNLSWEITEETSAGLDLDLFDKRLKVSFDVYNKVTKNIILTSKPVSTTGLSDPGYAHLGEVSNKGIELSIGWNDKIGDDWSYSISGNYSMNKNKLEKLTAGYNPIVGGNLGNGQDTKFVNDDAIGQPLGSFYLWEFGGLDAKGNATYVDANNNGVTGAQDATDKKFFGSYIPTSTLGININVRYKNADLTINGYGAFGHKIYNGKKAQRTGGTNIEYNVANDSWSPTNTGSSNPAPTDAIPIASTYYLESGDFFRINNISLGYTFINLAKNLSNLRIYVSAINPFILQKFSGFSPELNADGDPYGKAGIELDAYPTLRSFVFGLNIKF